MHYKIVLDDKNLWILLPDGYQRLFANIVKAVHQQGDVLGAIVYSFPEQKTEDTHQ